MANWYELRSPVGEAGRLVSLREAKVDVGSGRKNPVIMGVVKALLAALVVGGVFAVAQLVGHTHILEKTVHLLAAHYQDILFGIFFLAFMAACAMLLAVCLFRP